MEWHILFIKSFVSEFLKKVARKVMIQYCQTYPLVSGTIPIMEGLVLCLIFVAIQQKSRLQATYRRGHFHDILVVGCAQVTRSSPKLFFPRSA